MTELSSGVLAIISKVKERFKFFKSLRLRIMVILVIIGIVPSIIIENGIVNSYEDRAVSLRSFNVKNQCDILCNQLVSEQYLENGDSTVINSGLSLISSVYNGRVLIIGPDFKVVKDTYGIDEGKTVISEEVINCFKGTETNRYDKENRYIEVVVPIRDVNKDDKAVLGVMMVSVSTDEIVASIDILEQRGMTILIIIMIAVLILGFILSGILMRPFARVTKSIEDITDGFMDENISVPDYTETQLITDAFNKMLGRVTSLDKSRQEFVSNVSHELKTPLASMKVLADSLNSQENVPVELYQEFMQDITEEIDRENKIITDLLSLVKLDKQAGNMNIEEININDLMELILKRLRPIAGLRDIELTLDSFRPITAEIDETKLTLALSNLVENAIKYNNDGGWVRVSLNADPKYFYVTITDSGIGIPEDAIDDVFERFYRVDKSHSREIGGTGLGLAITRNSILMHHGAIKVHSNEGEGATFSVRIPLNYDESVRD